MNYLIQNAPEVIPDSMALGTAGVWANRVVIFSQDSQVSEVGNPRRGVECSSEELSSAACHRWQCSSPDVVRVWEAHSTCCSVYARHIPKEGIPASLGPIGILHLTAQNESNLGYVSLELTGN